MFGHQEGGSPDGSKYTIGALVLVESGTGCSSSPEEQRGIPDLSIEHAAGMIIKYK